VEFQKKLAAKEMNRVIILLGKSGLFARSSFKRSTLSSMGMGMKRKRQKTGYSVMTRVPKIALTI